MAVPKGIWRSAVVVLAALGGSGCLGLSADGECGGPSERCCVGSSCGTGLVCGPAQVCAPATFTVGGRVDGLTGTGLVLQNGGDVLPIAVAGPFTFPTALPTGSSYAVTVSAQPSGQTCTVLGGAGMVGTANVTSVTLTCTGEPLPTHTVGGSVSGLAGSGLVLQNNGGDNLVIASSGPFTFPTALDRGDHYAVSVLVQPPGQSCTVASGSGVIADVDVTNVTITCESDPLPRHSVGGTVTGLAGAGLVLRNNGTDDVSVTANGPFTFHTSLTEGSAYLVSVAGQPTGPSQTCTVSKGSGTVGGLDVTDVLVTCVTNPVPRYTVGGTVAGLAGPGFVLRNNGGDDLAVTTNGTFTFATPLTSGSTYSVTVRTQPSGQTCTISGGSGTIGSANVTSVAVSCVTNPPPRYTIGGTVNGLSGAGLVLRNNGADDLAVTANGSFTFATALTSGSTYSVTVRTQPSGQTCTVSSGSGTVANANVTGVTVSCITNPPPRYTIGGTVSGLTGTGLVLRNNGADDLAVTANGSFTFATALTSGGTYSVTVRTQPSGQTCTVSGGSGSVSNANVTSVRVSCGPAPTGPPALMQHVSSSTNILGRGLTANDFRFTLPNPVGSGNVLILGISYGRPAGQVVTIRDDQGNAWPATPTVMNTDTDGDLAAAIFVVPNARPGITTLTVSFSRPIDNTVFQYTVSEFHGVATTSTVSGTSQGTARQPTLSAGTFTPANNDASGGNLIWSYFADVSGATGSSTQASRFTAGNGSTLLDADIAAPTGSPPFPHASQYEVQTRAGPVTPGMSVTHLDGGGDLYLGLAVALRASPGAGTSPPPGMRIVHLSHLTNQALDAATWRLQFPSSGNLIVLTMQETNIIPVASVTDSLANDYLHLEPDDTVPQFWIAQGPAATASTLELTLQVTGGRGLGVTYLLYDVAGASAESYDGFAFKSQYDDPNGSDVHDSPVITPASAPGLTITATSFGQGPSSGLAPGCPAGAVFDFVHYSGETDLDTMDNADFRAHVFNTDRSTQHWNISVSNGNNGTNVSSTAAHFK